MSQWAPAQTIPGLFASAKPASLESDQQPTALQKMSPETQRRTESPKVDPMQPDTHPAAVPASDKAGKSSVKLCPKCGKPTSLLSRDIFTGVCNSCSEQTKKEKAASKIEHDRQNELHPTTALPWYYPASDNLLLIYLALSVMGTVVVLTQQTTTAAITFAIVGLFFAILFCCLGLVVLDAARQLRGIHQVMKRQQQATDESNTKRPVQDS